MPARTRLTITRATARCLQAEPIWLTAERQGVRTLVFDWPLSQAEHGPVHADYFGEKFDNALTDGATHGSPAGHLARGGQAAPLRLLMGYVEDADVAGHKYGPDAPETTAAVQAVDHTTRRVFRAGPGPLEGDRRAKRTGFT